MMVGAAALSLVQARAAVAPSPAAAPPAAAATPTPGTSLDLSNIIAPLPDVSGVWEVAHEQDNGQTSYTHLRIHQRGPSLSGDWLDIHGKAYPASGTLKGNDMNLRIEGPSGTITVQAQLDPPANMVGMFVEPNGQHLIFTANNQAKYTPEPEGTRNNGPAAPPH
ncbi:MAG: hypothetical protein KGM44_03355 [bacterium]|nr:hypothetical protein [bacterium]